MKLFIASIFWSAAWTKPRMSADAMPSCSGLLRGSPCDEAEEANEADETGGAGRLDALAAGAAAPERSVGPVTSVKKQASARAPRHKQLGNERDGVNLGCDM
jgi:hypothetical protein